jgi:glycosyltransferase involved in cell wall biosynthesis
MSALPLASCIMPTADRPRFVAHAVRYFLRQDYPNLELVVLDQGDQRVRHLMPDDARVRYLTMPRRASISELRNQACEAARGEVILHWDDDDWMAGWRVRYQVRRLIEAGADLSGTDRMRFLDLRDGSAWDYVYPSGRRPYICDSSLCYLRSFWRRHPFPSVAACPELAFQWSDTPKRFAILDRSDFYVGIIHAGNSSPKELCSSRWRRSSVEAVRSLLAGDWRHYQSGGPDTSPSPRSTRMEGSHDTDAG